MEEKEHKSVLGQTCNIYGICPDCRKAFEILEREERKAKAL